LFGRSQNDKQAIDVNSLVVRVLGILKSELKHNGITSRTELAPNLPPVVGHEGQLQEVIINLVQNAIDAMTSTPGRQRVLRIATKHHGNDEIELSVVDSGPGIDHSKIDSIFETFFTTKAGGMGLGLAICREIIERHEGELSVSADVNGGALFRFTFCISTTAGQERRFCDVRTTSAYHIRGPRRSQKGHGLVWRLARPRCPSGVIHDRAIQPLRGRLPLVAQMRTLVTTATPLQGRSHIEGTSS
jgi:hypothetical protein